MPNTHETIGQCQCNAGSAISRRRTRTAVCMTSSTSSNSTSLLYLHELGGVVVSTAAFHARVRGSVPGLGGLKENVSSPSTCESQYCGEPP